MTVFLIVIVVLVVLVGYYLYARLIRRRNQALEALSSIDVQLRKRHDLIPNVLKMANKFMSHERELLDNLTRLRTEARQSYDPSDSQAVEKHLNAEGGLQIGMRQLFAVAENYPELKSSETIVQAQQTFNEVEGHIAAARRFYNSSVTQLNNAVQIFPGSVIARMINVKEMPFFEIEEEAARRPVDADEFLQVGDTPEA